jgi:hypothetical protein
VLVWLAALLNSRYPFSIVTDELAGLSNPNDIAKFRNKHAQELGLVDTQDIIAAREAATTPPTTIAGVSVPFTGGIDNEKFKKELVSRTATKYNQDITNLRQGLDQLYNNKQKPSSLGTPPAKSSKVRVQYKGKILEIDGDKLPQALKDGAVEVR